MNNAFPELKKGGRFAPKHCKARQKVAVVFPYRDRERNLFLVLNNLIPFLMAQNIEFQVFIVEQVRGYIIIVCLLGKVNVHSPALLKFQNFRSFHYRRMNVHMYSKCQ